MIRSVKVNGLVVYQVVVRSVVLHTAMSLAGAKSYILRLSNTVSTL